MVKEEEEKSVVANVTTTSHDSAVSTATAGQLPPSTVPPCPNMPQEKADKLQSQPQKVEAQWEEPAGEATMLPVHLDKEGKMSPVQERVTKTVQEKNKLSPGQEVLTKMSPSRMSSPQLQVLSPQPSSAEEEDCRSTPLSSPRVKGRRNNLRETDSETPPRIPICTPAPSASPSHMVALSSPPRSVLKRQDEPMVVLHCLPTKRLPPEAPTADSDTDSATEEEEEEEEEGEEEEEEEDRLGSKHKKRKKKNSQLASAPQLMAAPSKCLKTDS